MDKTLRNVVVVGILAASFSLLWTLVYLPYKREYDLNNCLVKSESTLERKHSEIQSHIDDLERQKTAAQGEADKKLQEFLKDNPEPRELSDSECGDSSNECKNTSTRLSYLACMNSCKDNGRSSWNMKKRSIHDSVRDIGGQIENISSDFEKIEKEKEESDNECYRRFK